MRISDWSSDVCSSDLEERGVLVLVGVARRTLDPWVRGPHQALLVLHQLQDVFLRADMIDFAQLRIILDEGLPLLAVERRSEEHTSELQSLMRISYAVFCLKKNKQIKNNNHKHDD